MINSLPIYSNVPETLKQRKEKFYQEVGPLYASLTKMNKSEYFKIKQEFDAGDNTALDRLMDDSVYFIVEDVVDIFAKYDVDGVLSIEDTISACIERYNTYLHSFYELPEVYSKYTNSTIQQYIFFAVVREYRNEINRTKNTDWMDPDQFAATVDNERQYEISDMSLTKQQFKIAIKPILKTLSPQQANIINMYFDEKNPKGIKEIAKELNISRGRVNQLLIHTLEKIRGDKKVSKLKVFRDAQFRDESHLDLNY